MTVKRVNLGEWLPDQPSVIDSVTEATNVIPLAVGYGYMNQPVAYSNAASETLNSVFAGKYNTTTVIFTGGNTKLFNYDGATKNLNDVSKVGGYSCLGWNWVQFGNSVLAVNDTDKIQSWTIGTSTAFADVSASAPIAKYITLIRDFVVVANLDGGANSNKVQWSDINDESDWVSGATSQSDFQILSDGGNIRGITGGEFGLILLDRAIFRMQYIGSPYFFQFDNVSRNLGCMAGGSVVQYGSTTYFLSDNGFYSYDGVNLNPIGANKVDNYFKNFCDVSQIDTITSAIDPEKKIVVWNFLNNNNSRSLIIYNWQVQRWSIADTTIDGIASIATSGITLEGLDVFGNVDTIATSFDSRLWVGGRMLFAGVDTDKIYTFTGDRESATITTNALEDGYNTVVTLVRPQIDNGSCNVSIASTKELDDTITFSTPVATTSEGRACVRSAGRYHRVKLNPTGLWTSAIGLDINAEQQGER